MCARALQVPGDSCPRARPVAGQLLVPGGAAHPLRPVRPVPERDPGAASSTRHVGAEGQTSPWAAVPGPRPSSCVRFSCPTRTPSVLTSSPSYDTVRSPSRPRGRSLVGGSGRCAGHSSVGACGTRPAPRRRAGAALVGPHAPEAVSFPRPVCSQLGHRSADDEGEQLGLVSASHGDSLSLGTLSKSI